MNTGPSGRTGQSGASACCWASRGAFVAQALPPKNGNPRVDKKWNHFSKLSVVWLRTSRAQAPEGRVGMQKQVPLGAGWGLQMFPACEHLC